MQLSIRDLTFAYPGGEPVFEHLNLNLDTGWRLGVIGRNGRGKTTLLRLMMGRMPFEGAIDLPLEAVYFPYEVSDASLPALEVLRRAAPGAEGDLAVVETLAQLINFVHDGFVVRYVHGGNGLVHCLHAGFDHFHQPVG